MATTLPSDPVAKKLKRVKAKKRCCKSRPRCKKCPVTCKRLEKLGKATRDGKRAWVLVEYTRQGLRAALSRWPAQAARMPLSWAGGSYLPCPGRRRVSRVASL